MMIDYVDGGGEGVVVTVTMMTMTTIMACNDDVVDDYDAADDDDGHWGHDDNFRPRPKRTCLINGKKMRLSDYKQMMKTRKQDCNSSSAAMSVTGDEGQWH